VTNVLTGVFNPALSPDGTQLAVERYSSNGVDIHMTDLNKDTWIETAYNLEEQPEIAQEPLIASHSSEHGYNPLPSLLPKIWMPSWGEDEEGAQLGLSLFGMDVLNQHRYSLSVLHGLDSDRLSYSAAYTNHQFYPEITLFGYDTATEFGDIFNDGEEEEAEYWQRDRGFGIEIGIPVYVSQKTQVSLFTGYRYNKLESLLDESEVLNPTPDEGTLSGVSAGIEISNLDASVYAISPEQGVWTSVTYQHDNKELGSDFDLHTVVGETAVFLEVPKLRHHVLMLGAAGGMSEGDTLAQGIFQLGGYSLNTGSIELDDRQFFLRGYEHNAFSGNRVALGSAEYRFPLWYPQRGLFKGWLFFDSIAGAAFYDVGNAWDGETEWEDFKHSVGGELRLNLGLRYNELPLSLRFGFAEGLDDEGESQLYFAVGTGLGF
jgi:outer membrane protein assembly factor BamA